MFNGLNCCCGFLWLNLIRPSCIVDSCWCTYVRATMPSIVSVYFSQMLQTTTEKVQIIPICYFRMLALKPVDRRRHKEKVNVVLFCFFQNNGASTGTDGQCLCPFFILCCRLIRNKEFSKVLKKCNPLILKWIDIFFFYRDFAQALFSWMCSYLFVVLLTAAVGHFIYKPLHNTEACSTSFFFTGLIPNVFLGKNKDKRDKK